MSRETTATPEPSVAISHRLASWCLAGTIGFFRWIPAWFAFALADLAAVPLVVASWSRERRVGRGVHRNLRIAYRNTLTRRQGRRVRWAWARHMTWMAVDFCRMPRIQRHNLHRYVDLEEWPEVERVFNEKPGLICVTGHIGVGDLLGHVASLQGLPVTGVFRPMPFGPIDRLIRAIRTSGGQRILTKWGAVWPMKKALDRGEAVGMAADENTTNRPIFVPFLGTPAATNETPALLHLTTGAPIAVLSIHRIARLRYRFHIWDVIRHPRSDDRAQDVKQILTQVNAALSKAIRTYPAQWFWGLRRFHTRPNNEVPGPDGLPPVAHPGTKALDLEARR